MADVVTVPFDHYTLYYFTGSETGFPRAEVFCYRGEDHVGRIYFWSRDMHDNDYAPGAGPWISYPLTSFNDVMTTLRYEKPLFLCMSLDSRNAWLATSEDLGELEPVGEEEGGAAFTADVR